jgi:hypothetical protein
MIGNVGTISQGSVLCYACQMPAKVSVSSFRSLWGHTLEIKPRGMLLGCSIFYHFFINLSCSSLAPTFQIEGVLSECQTQT